MSCEFPFTSSHLDALQGQATSIYPQLIPSLHRAKPVNQSGASLPRGKQGQGIVRMYDYEL